MELQLLILIPGAVVFLLTIVPLLVYAERKVSALIQDREGPNRVHLEINGVRLTPKGLLQPLADAIKLIFKEDLIPAKADKFLFALAPVIAVVPNAAAFCVIPFGNRIGEVDLQVADANAGILIILAMTGISVYALALGGWAANSKYPLMGGVRATAQVISYEIALGLALLSVLMTAGTLDLQEIVRGQASSFLDWNICKQPLAFVLLLVAGFAENNRQPFDMPEAEPELVGGYHTEYSGMKFAMFFMGEYLAMVTMSSVVVTLFLGGWSLPISLPGIGLLVDPGSSSLLTGVLSMGVFVVKLVLMLWLYIQVRWTIPRFRYDQLMNLGWKRLIPLALANLVVTAIVLAV